MLLTFHSNSRYRFTSNIKANKISIGIRWQTPIVCTIIQILNVNFAITVNGPNRSTEINDYIFYSCTKKQIKSSEKSHDFQIIREFSDYSACQTD